jgi:hypothetical protein
MTAYVLAALALVAARVVVAIRESRKRDSSSRERNPSAKSGDCGSRASWASALDPARAGDPKNREGFAYPAYVIFVLAPLIGFSFTEVQN